MKAHKCVCDPNMTSNDYLKVIIQFVIILNDKNIFIIHRLTLIMLNKR